ncbi:hypothetical protein [Thermosulfurimonas sp. F29]|uniref:hypothetical protein n=1 Tax=Thermosulfurimonas sp. F29 TaxID=2867247 RepID=UPI001C82D3AE|nr:hypothetical protein [Thermosulfurimonas sp. F29]MBX6422736.1 hypothetical protein [Thermosulfurimonas sp. F29]
MESLAPYVLHLRDLSGLPFYPWLFEFLLVLTLALHLLVVNLVLGSTMFLLWGRLFGGSFGLRLSRSLSRVLPISLSWAIVLGVAPLLFIQVIYDPFWYFSNVISAWWALAFLGLIALAFSLAYLYYLRGGYEGAGNPLWILLALMALLLVAAIIHALSLQAVHPEKWPEWTAESRGLFETGGRLHAFSLPRYLHFILASVAVTGIFLMLYARYFEVRKDFDPSYLAWVGRIGVRTALVFSLLQAGAGLWWLGSLPAEFRFYTQPLFLLAALSALLLILLLFVARRDPARHSLRVAVVAGLTVFLMSYAREVLRMKYLSRAGYRFSDYPVNPSWSSTALFFLSFLMGLLILGYVGLVAYRAGRGQREVGAHGWGKLAVALCWIWIGIMVTLGLIISFKNGVLP